MDLYCTLLPTCFSPRLQPFAEPVRTRLWIHGKWNWRSQLGLSDDSAQLL
uniref:Uncharacterized protein n=1 Tax=Anguilla anguilla TaxID=7936 RepID=A0A0E9SUS7_ANGAN